MTKESYTFIIFLFKKLTLQKGGKILFTELIKLLNDKKFYISLISLILIMIGSVITGVSNHYENYNLMSSIYQNNQEVLNFVSPHKEWIGLSISNFFSSLYYFIFPLIISISLTDSIYIEKLSGNINYSLIRMKRENYYFKKFLFTYIISFLLFIIPLLIGLILINIFTGQWDYSYYSNSYKELIEGIAVLPDDSFIGDKKELFSSLLEQSPYLYILAYYLIGGFFASGYICIGLALSLFLNNRYLIIFIPQIVYIGSWLIFTVLGKMAWDPFNFLDPKQPVVGIMYLPIIVFFIIQLFVAITTYILGVKKNSDVLS